MGDCHSASQQGDYFIDVNSHRILFVHKGVWCTGIVRETMKREYLVVYEFDGDWEITTLLKSNAEFISPDLWDLYYEQTISEDLSTW